MTDLISLLLPTRQRPEQLFRLIKSVNDTAAELDHIELVYYTDDDDFEYNFWPDIPSTQITGPRYHDGLVNLSVKWNKCYEVAEGNILMHCGDDIVFRTPGWDNIVREHFDDVPDKILFVFGQDGYSDGNNFGTHGFVHRKWVEAVGYFVPPYFVSDYNDAFLNDVAKLVGRHREIPIYTEHMHYCAGKAEIDQNTQDRLERHAECDPETLYYSPKIQAEIQETAEKLKGVMDVSTPRLSILIATVGERDESFQKLISVLQPQAQSYPGDIEVLVHWNNFEKPIAEIRQALVEEARGDYICFIDDDDMIPSYYCDRIMTAIETNPDYVGWRMQLWFNGEKMKPTYHSLRYDRWWDDEDGYYRNTSHLNPIKRDIALRVPFDGKKGPEDVSWARGVAPLVHSEEYIDEPMYFYHYNSTDSIWQRGVRPNQDYVRPFLTKHFRYHPDSRAVFFANGKRPLDAGLI